MVRLQNKTEKKLIKPDQLEDGDLAEIIKWGTTHSYTGTIVQRYKDKLITVGKYSGHRWDNVDSSDFNDGSCLLRVLEKGELIEVC